MTCSFVSQQSISLTLKTQPCLHRTNISYQRFITPQHNSSHLQLAMSFDDCYYYYYLSDDRHEEDKLDSSNYIIVVNTILSGTARLNLLLPTATILAFTISAPLLTNEGQCSEFDRWLMGSFLTLLALTCVFFSLTDSFRTSTGRLYYGVATIHGIRTFGGRSHVRPRVLSDYKLRRSDLLHASLGLIAFLAFALTHGDVLSCYGLVLKRKFANVFPLVVGFVVSLLFVVFPSRRRGIGYPFLVHSDGALSYVRN